MLVNTYPKCVAASILMIAGATSIAILINTFLGGTTNLSKSGISISRGNENNVKKLECKKQN